MKKQKTCSNVTRKVRQVTINNRNPERTTKNPRTNLSEIVGEHKK